MKKIPDLRPYVGTEQWFATPFTVVDLKGSVWNMATDRAWIVAVHGKGRYPRWSGSMSQLNIILGLIQSRPVEPRIAPTKDVLGWATSAKGELGNILGVTVDTGRLEKLLGVVAGQHIQVWDARSSMRQDPCLGALSMGTRFFLIDHTTDKVMLPTFDVGLTQLPEPNKPEKKPPEEWAGFDLAMSLDDEASGTPG